MNDTTKKINDLNNYIYPVGGEPKKYDKCAKCGDEFISPSKYKFCFTCAKNIKIGGVNDGK